MRFSRRLLQNCFFCIFVWLCCFLFYGCSDIIDTISHKFLFLVLILELSNLYFNVSIELAYSKNDFDIYLLIFRLKVDFILLLLKIYIHYVPQIIFFSWIIGEHISNTYFRFTNTVLPPFVIFDSMLLETTCVRTGFFFFSKIIIFI